MSESKQCPFCFHYAGTPDDRPDVQVCAAFPDGIPEEILTGDLDHSKPVAGDNGIQFLPATTPIESDNPE